MTREQYDKINTTRTVYVGSVVKAFPAGVAKLGTNIYKDGQMITNNPKIVYKKTKAEVQVAIDISKTTSVTGNNDFLGKAVTYYGVPFLADYKEFSELSAEEQAEIAGKFTGEKIVNAELNTWKVATEGRVMHTFNVNIDNLLDVSNPCVRKQLGVTLDDIVGNSYDVTHKIGEFAKAKGYSGIIAPSARADGGVNVILFSGKSVK